MNIDLVIEQIKLFVPLFQGRVAGAADFARGLETEAMLGLPAAYVVPFDDEATDNDEQQALYQVVTERIGVVVEFDNQQDRRGQGVSSQYNLTRAAIWRALLNWNPDPVQAPRGLSYGGGRLLEMDRGRLFYQWDFLLEIQITDADGFPAGQLGAQGTGSDAVPLREIDSNSDSGDPPLPARAVLPQ